MITEGRILTFSHEGLAFFGAGDVLGIPTPILIWIAVGLLFGLLVWLALGLLNPRPLGQAVGQISGQPPGQPAGQPADQPAAPAGVPAGVRRHGWWTLALVGVTAAWSPHPRMVWVGRYIASWAIDITRLNAGETTQFVTHLAL